MQTLAEFEVRFKIHYKVEFGQSISILGGAAETGTWQDFKKAAMKWTNGDYWQITLRVKDVF